MATSKTAKVLLIVGGLVFLFFVMCIIGLAVLMSSFRAPAMASNTVLILNVSGGLPDYVAEDELAKAFGIAQKQSFSSLLTQIRKAKVDKRIGGMVLDINFPGIGWGKANELREAIADFKTTGKPVYAYMEIGMNREYYIATAADKIFLAPAGDLYVNGFAAEAMFYKGSLDKLGIEAEVIQVGPKYKNAPDQYTKKEMGEGQKEVINAILDEYFRHFTTAIAESRKKTVDEVKAIVDDAPYHARDAKEIGLIDGASTEDEVYAQMKTRLGYDEDEELKTIRTSAYRDIPSDSLGLNNGERVAVIFASGAITLGSSNDSIFGGQMTGSDTIVRAVNDAAADRSIKAIVLRIDSPGGSALASDQMWHAIESAKKKGKPVVVSMSDVAASGGYYIATNADRIVAEPTTITGSIGVFMGKPVVKGFYDWLGITNQYTMRGKNAGIFRETEKWTPEERAKMEEQTNKIYYEDFLPKVADGRNMDVEKANSIGQGHVWTGTQAKENGLIDEFGGFEKAISIAKQLANLPEDKDVHRVVFPEPQPFFEAWLGDPDASEIKEQKAKAAIFESLPEDVRRAFRYVEMFEQMKHGEAILMLPYELSIK
ncbi:MAG TPA: signal peptide peptidase SppA [Pyrinomonadaceae bacterium]|jgi:protease-4|nr:signal peptide peptidase SppA [Pyrinomonadaceae bacterium]